MKKASSMTEDRSNLSNSCFGCYFRHSLVNFKSFIILFWNMWVIYGLQKSWASAAFDSEHIYQKQFVICDPESLNSMPEYCF